MILKAVAAASLYPLLLPVWEKNPPTWEEVSPGPPPTEITQIQMELQRRGFAHGDRELRTRIAVSLGRSGTDQAWPPLTDQLAKEKDPAVVACLLQQLAALPSAEPGLAPTAMQFLLHPGPDVRYWAVKLYAGLPDMRIGKLQEMIRQESREYIRNAAVKAMLENAAKAGADEFRGLRQNPCAAVRAEAVKAVPKFSITRSDRSFLLDCCEDPAPSVRRTLARSVEDCPSRIRQQVIPRLCDDRHASVRGAAAECMGNTRDHGFLDLVLSLSEDQDSEVRRMAVAAAPGFESDRILSRLVMMLGDERGLVRKEAEESIFALDSKLQIAESVGARLGDPKACVRFHVYNLLGRIRASQFAERIAGSLNLEELPENLAAAVRALGRLDATFAAQQVARLGKHQYPEVREEVARALGSFSTEATFEMIKKLAFDTDDDVRQAAVVSMGRIGDGKAFSRTLLDVLGIVDEDEERMSSRNRAAAAWSAARLEPADPSLVERLVKHATVALIRTEEGMEYDGEMTMISSAFALVRIAQKFPSVRKEAEYVIGRHMIHPDSVDPNAASGSDFPISLSLYEFARQGKALLESRPITEKTPCPPRNPTFPCRQYPPPSFGRPPG